MHAPYLLFVTKKDKKKTKNVSLLNKFRTPSKKVMVFPESAGQINKRLIKGVN